MCIWLIIAGMATGSILVAWHVAWSLDLYMSSSLSSESESPGICCSWIVSGLCYPSGTCEPYIFSGNSCKSECSFDQWVKVSMWPCAQGGCHGTQTSQIPWGVCANFGRYWCWAWKHNCSTRRVAECGIATYWCSQAIRLDKSKTPLLLEHLCHDGRPHRVSDTALALMVVYWEHMAYPRLRVRSVKRS